MLSPTSTAATIANVRRYNAAQTRLGETMTRLATGQRINKASDDPSGMIAANSLGARRVELETVIRKAEENKLLLDTADGGYAQIADSLIELEGILVRAANTGGMTKEERAALQAEADSILGAIDSVVANTSFNKRKILAQGTMFQSGDTFVGMAGIGEAGLGVITRPAPVRAEVSETIAGGVSSLNLSDLRSGGALNLIDGDLEGAQSSLSRAQEQISTLRAGIGNARRYTLGSEIDAKRLELENTSAAESAIRDADYAYETSMLVRDQAVAQASLAAIQIAQQTSQQVLSLLIPR